MQPAMVTQAEASGTRVGQRQPTHRPARQRLLPTGLAAPAVGAWIPRRQRRLIAQRGRQQDSGAHQRNQVDAADNEEQLTLR